MLTCNGFSVTFKEINNFLMSVLVSNMKNINRFNSHKQKVFGIFTIIFFNVYF